MKRIVIISALLCMGLAFEANAQTITQKTVEVSKAIPVSTRVDNARYEFIQSTINGTQAFLLDKYTGKVWRYFARIEVVEHGWRAPYYPSGL